MQTRQQVATQQKINEQTHTGGNFVNCTASVDAFIDNILTFKDCTGVTNENALRGLSMMLQGQAAIWWQGIKSSIVTWDNAITTLREVYSRKLPPHLVYHDLFGHEQIDEDNTEHFVCQFRALIAQLPYTLQERIQLDMIYGLLSRKIRKRIPRDDVTSFKELLQRARVVEQSLREHDERRETTVTEEKSKKPNKDRPKCEYCRRIGHKTTECRTKAANEKKEPNPTVEQKKESKIERPVIRCYGCNAPGVIRAECRTCTPEKKNVAVNAATFYSAEVEQQEETVPAKAILPIKILGIRGTAIADSGATHSIAGRNLFDLIKSQCEVKQEKTKVKLADGSTREQEMTCVQVDEQICHKLIPLKMIVLSGGHDNRTLLGSDFLDKAKVVINIPSKLWYFDEEPDNPFPFENETLTFPVPEVLTEDTSLRADEGVKLQKEERSELNALLKEYEDVFQPGGGPTSFAEHAINIETGQAPSAVPAYKLSKPRKEQLQTELDKMLEQGVIEECESPWAASVVLTMTSIPCHGLKTSHPI